MKAYPKIPCTGFGCTARITKTPSRKTTLCRSCSNREIARSPHRRAAAAAQMKAIHADPEQSRERSAKAAASLREKLATDAEFARKWSDRGRHLGRTPSPGMRLIPQEYHALYLSLARWRYSAQQRLAMVQDQIRADRRAAESSKGGMIE